MHTQPGKMQSDQTWQAIQTTWIKRKSSSCHHTAAGCGSVTCMSQPELQRQTANLQGAQLPCQASSYSRRQDMPIPGCVHQMLEHHTLTCRNLAPFPEDGPGRVHACSHLLPSTKTGPSCTSQTSTVLISAAAAQKMDCAAEAGGPRGLPCAGPPALYARKALCRVWSAPAAGAEGSGDPHARAWLRSPLHRPTAAAPPNMVGVRRWWSSWYPAATARAPSGKGAPARVWHLWVVGPRRHGAGQTMTNTTTSSRVAAMCRGRRQAAA
jgi:hypothetical protein